MPHLSIYSENKLLNLGRFFLITNNKLGEGLNTYLKIDATYQLPNDMLISKYHAFGDEYVDIVHGEKSKETN